MSVQVRISVVEQCNLSFVV